MKSMTCFEASEFPFSQPKIGEMVQKGKEASMLGMGYLVFDIIVQDLA
jgi:hypothetical protein